MCLLVEHLRLLASTLSLTFTVEEEQRFGSKIEPILTGQGDYLLSCLHLKVHLGVMRVPSLRWVLWDVKDTLLKVRMSVGEQYCKEAERMGLSLNPVDINSAFHQAYKSYSTRFPNYGIAQGLNGHTWWTAVVKDSFYQCGVHDPALLQTISHNLYHNFCNAQNWEVFDDSKTVLESCVALGLKLGVVSNFDNRLETILKSCDLLSHFSFLITSEEANVAKPSPLIFEQALQKCGVSAAEVAHVGDHYVKDYLASRSVGIHGFLLDRGNNYEQSDMVPKEHCLNSLEELPLRLLQHLK